MPCTALSSYALGLAALAVVALATLVFTSTAVRRAVRTHQHGTA